MIPVRGGWLLAFLILGLTFMDLSRFSLHTQGEPVFFLPADKRVSIELQGLGDDNDGIRQFSGCEQLVSVIKMTAKGLDSMSVNRLQSCAVYEPGKLLEFKEVSPHSIVMREGWMSAAKRMALGVPLQVNRMEEQDWDDLPGVGPSLAKALTLDRQKNGDFDRYESLLRVKGVGEKSLEKWRPFF